ncbi:ABC transporter substrate-binding protein [Cohnella sp. WQ 127256]|uniref:ABC transporter substrate-binding protein n=1 Tax=Cohnella sp. WQ 127256 TaxID=2938790 RepID=UPI0021192DE0|nr:extracellular solute-binding protein [Cohnella sp. WQ 127256]
MKRVIRIGSLVAVSLLLLVGGCAPKTESQMPVNAVSSQEAQEVLNISGFKSGSELGTIPELNDKFMRENPGIKVIYEGMPGNLYNTYIETRFAAGDAADVVMLHSGAEMSRYAKAGFLMDIGDEDWLNGFTPDALKAVSYEGQVYGTPNDMVILGVYYNQLIFDKLGIQIPQDWDAFLAVCKSLKEAGINPIAIGNNDGWMTLAALFTMAPSMIYAKDPDYDRKLLSGEVHFSGTWDEMLDRWFSLDKLKYLTPDSVGISQEQAVRDFATEQSAMMINGSWSLAGIQKMNDDIRVGMFPMPANNKGEELIVSADVGTAWVINKKSKHAQAAKKYLEFWSKEENLSLWTRSQGAFLTIKDGNNDVAPAFTKISAALSKSKSYRFLNQGWSSAGDVTATEISKSAQGVYLNALTPKEMLENIDNTWDKNS